MIKLSLGTRKWWGEGFNFKYMQLQTVTLSVVLKYVCLCPKRKCYQSSCVKGMLKTVCGP